MRGLPILVLSLCLGIASAIPSSPSDHTPSPNEESEDSSNVLMKREYYDPYYSANSRYYKYPAHERTSNLPGDKEPCPVLKLLIPLIVITIFAGILAFNSIGLVPNFNLPALAVDPAAIAALAALKPGIGKRSVDDEGAEDGELSEEAHGYYENISQGAFSRLTNFVLDSIESEDCPSRLVCETGRYVEGRTFFVSLMEFITPPIYENKLKIFKDSALNKANCSLFQCGYVDDNSI